jgi:hypothetical protein
MQLGWCAFALVLVAVHTELARYDPAARAPQTIETRLLTNYTPSFNELSSKHTGVTLGGVRTSHTMKAVQHKQKHSLDTFSIVAMVVSLLISMGGFAFFAATMIGERFIEH